MRWTRREFSGMIPVITSNFIIPATPISVDRQDVVLLRVPDDSQREAATSFLGQLSKQTPLKTNIITHRIHGAGIYMLSWLGYIDGKCYHI
jgi:hypothetical protein